jgi:hypothetical protein
MIIPKNVIILWPGSNASIPSGWVRETALDGRHAKAWGTQDPNNTGGNATHSHTSPVHSHAVNAHHHAFTMSTVNANQDASNNSGSIMMDNHNHSGTTDDSTSGNTSSDAVSYGAVSNDPPYQTMIHIKPTGGRPIPSLAIILHSNSTIPTGFHHCDGASSTPDLRNLYLKGAATSADAGSTGGSLTNVHDISHSHVSGASHAHTATSSTTGNDQRDNDNSPNNNYRNHNHYFTTDSAVAPVDAYSGSLTTSESVEPVFAKLLALQNISGLAKSGVKGMIGLWLGLLNKVPEGWVLCDGNNGTPNLQDKFIKVAYDASEIGLTGGSNTHTHAAQSHSHTNSAGHTHSASVGHSQSAGGDGVGSRSCRHASDSVHTLSYCENVVASLASANTTADSTDNQPLYLTVAYIMFKFSLGGAILATI